MAHKKVLSAVEKLDQGKRNLRVGICHCYTGDQDKPTEHMIFEHIIQGGKGVIHADFWRMSISGGGNMQGKYLKAEIPYIELKGRR